jgi:hypothetical protein
VADFTKSEWDRLNYTVLKLKSQVLGLWVGLGVLSVMLAVRCG